MTILNEQGAPEVLPPLRTAGDLAKRLPGALVIVVGTISEAHLLRPLASPFASPDPGYGQRLASLVLDPDEPPQQGQVATRVIGAAAGQRGTELVLLVAGRSARLLGVDADFEARLVARRLDLPVEVVDPDEPYVVPGVLSTDLWDRILAALVDVCPKRRTSDLLEAAPAKRVSLLGNLLGRSDGDTPVDQGRPVVLLGAPVSPGATQEVVQELSRARVEVAGVVPGTTWAALPAVGEGTVVAAMDTNLSAAAAAARERGAKVVRTLAPVGVEGTARFVQDVAQEAGLAVAEMARARSAWTNLEPLRNRVRGRRLFFAGDTGLEIPLARFLADAGAVVLEVGAPRLDKRHLSEELQALGPDVDVVESPDWRGQLRG